MRLLEPVPVTEDSDEAVRDFRTAACVLLSECLADAGRWAEGLEQTGRALKVRARGRVCGRMRACDCVRAGGRGGGV